MRSTTGRPRSRSHRPFRLLAGGMALIALGAAAAGCSSSGGSSAAGASASGSTGPQGTPIKVMTIVPLSGNNITYPPIAAGAQISAAYLNATGGINGHPVDLEICDDQNNPNQATACAQKAVADNDVAVIGSYTTFGDNVMPTLTAAHIPEIAQFAISNLEVTADNAFTVNAGPLVSVGMGAAAGQLAPKNGTVGLIETPSSLTSYSEQLIEAGLKSSGFTGTVKIIPVQAAATDYAPAVAQASGADVLVLGFGQAQAQAFLPALAQANYKQQKLVGLAGNSLAASVVKANPTVTQGATVVDYYPPFDTSVWAPFRAAIAKYGTSSQKSEDLSLLGAENTWIGFQILREVGSKMTGDITATALMKALQASSSVGTGGIIPPLNFTNPFSVAALRSLYNTSVTYDQVNNGLITWPAPVFHNMTVPFTKYMG